MRDDWEKTRTTNTHLTGAEIAQLRTAFNCGRKPRDIARELKCSSRIAAKYFAQFRCSSYRRPVPDTSIRSVAVSGPRFYKSNFEL
jgi:hypothetical protein